MRISYRLALSVFALNLSACSMFTADDATFKAGGSMDMANGSMSKAGGSVTEQPAAQAPILAPPIASTAASIIAKERQALGFHIKQMTHELLSNIDHVKPDSVIATSSFVYLDSNFDTSPLFAKQIQESFTYEVHKVGQPVIEYKATGYIRITEAGDFALSKDFKELKQIQPIDYILLGTLAKQTHGVLVNAKLVGAKSQAVVAAAQRHIPNAIIDKFTSSHQQEPPKIKQPPGVLIQLKAPKAKSPE